MERSTSRGKAPERMWHLHREGSAPIVLGDRPVNLAELLEDDLAALLRMLDALVAENRLKPPVGGIR